MTNSPNGNGSLKDDARYKELEDRLISAGCFSPARWWYAMRVGLIVSVGSGAFAGLLLAPNWPIRLALILALAIACVQAAFVAHDVGDGALTSNNRTSSALRQLLLTFFCGTSSTYFHHLHRLHHLSLDRRPQAGGSGRFLTNKYELHWLKSLLSVSGPLFMVGTILLRGFTFRAESVRFVLANPSTTKADKIVLIAHYLVWLMVPAIVLGWGTALLNLALVTLLAGAYIGTVLVLNHEGMSRVDEVAGLAAFDRVLATTRNLPGSQIADVTLGGINNHIEHHLFPDLPDPRLPKARKIVRNFCLHEGLPYQETSFTEALGSALKHFRVSPRSRLTAEALS